jgi:hypothetical protein
MENLKLLVEQLKAAGITPKVSLIIPVEGADIPAIKSAQSKLQGEGIVAEIQININVGNVLTPGAEPDAVITGEKSFAVVVNADKTNCLTFTKSDKAGKPIMEIREPRVQLFRGNRLSVSAEHKVSEKDPGDGSVIGTGGFKYYFVVDCPTKPEAKGLYVKESDVTVA